ncbi:MAG: DUF3071 domain-containing protein [Propionibacteriaceae bacterium]|nr:DUF3071 domain-containing protein [Propionibacteriaceae bacterium]
MADSLEIHMESALSPREIQARIRAGEAVADVAKAAGVPLENIEPFAVPVLAERDYIASQARAQHVRRGSETIAHRSLEEVVADRLSSRGIDPKALSWDAWQTARRKWSVKVSYESGKAHREAIFAYDQDGRFSVPDNEDARWLLGLHSASHGPQPGRRRPDENTVELNPELDLVRVVQETDDYLDEAAYDAYTEGELVEDPNGVFAYDTNAKSDMDVLYDILSGLDEDSVRIYTGLVAEQNPAGVQPLAEPAQPALDEAAAPEAPDPLPAPKPKRKRAKVPSWDEIVFGSPRQNQ